MPGWIERSILVAVVALACGLVGSAALAQMPPDIAAKIAALGRVVDPNGTATIYAPLQESEPYAGIKAVRDVKYGPSERNRVDVFAPETADGPRPVLMFMHGGSYTRGDASWQPLLRQHRDSGRCAAEARRRQYRKYRLAPMDPWPAAEEDLGRAIRFVAENSRSYGADPDRIYLMGQFRSEYASCRPMCRIRSSSGQACERARRQCSPPDDL